MFKRLWLLFAQVTTVSLALLFVLATLRPDWLASDPPPSQVGGAFLPGVLPGQGGPASPPEEQPAGQVFRPQILAAE